MVTGEQVILVNEHDQMVGTAEKLRAHREALLHRAFSIFLVTRQHDEWFTLLQQRQMTKYHCGGLWTNACCSHPRPGETILQAAERRLPEELGFPLQHAEVVGQFIYREALNAGMTEYEFDHVVIASAAMDSVFDVNPDEVMDTHWVSIATLLSSERANPNRYTPWLRPATVIVEAALQDKQVPRMSNLGAR